VGPRTIGDEQDQRRKIAGHERGSPGVDAGAAHEFRQIHQQIERAAGEEQADEPPNVGPGGAAHTPAQQPRPEMLAGEDQKERDRHPSDDVQGELVGTDHRSSCDRERTRCGPG
jgi:hypothetical protein